MKRKAAFLDRDGTLMEDSGFIGEPARVRLLDGVAEALDLLARAGYARVVVTNQSGVARGMFDAAAVDGVNAELRRQLAAQGATLDAFYSCVHLDGCDCRKPQPGLVHRAVAEMGLDLPQSVLFGDRWSDVALAHNVGIPAILIEGTEEYEGLEPLARVPNLLAGVRLLLATHAAR